MRSDDPRLIGLLQAAEVLLLPSLSETFGLVILEAWSAGTPVLCSGTSGARALVRDRENGCLFSLDDPETFHRGLDFLLSNPTHARGMAATGHKVVAAKYSVAAVAAEVKKLYVELIEEKLCGT